MRRGRRRRGQIRSTRSSSGAEITTAVFNTLVAISAILLLLLFVWCKKELQSLNKETCLIYLDTFGFEITRREDEECEQLLKAGDDDEVKFKRMLD